MNPQTIISFLGLVNELISIAKDLRTAESKEEPKSAEPVLDPWQGMLFQQSGPNRSFPRLAARRVNLAKDSQTAKLAKIRKIPNHDGNDLENMVMH